MIEGSRQAVGELDVGDDEMDTEGDPELTEDSVTGGTEETFDPEMLLDPFEEKFDFPAGLCRCRRWL